ncbi:MAG: ABC transporter substrate-binding protein [Pseudomonadota bacterium]
MAGVKRREVLVASSLFALGATACGPTMLFAEKRKKRLVVATAKEIGRLGITGGGGSETSNVVMLIFDTLVTLDEKLNVAGKLAVKWFQSSDTEWTFELRPGVLFSNGEACDASAVAHSIERLATLVPAYSYRNQWGSAWPPRARVIDATTVAVSTPVPQVTLPRLLSRIPIAPPRASQSPDFANTPIGSGPYKIKSWTRGGSLLLEANQRHYNGPPHIDELAWISIPNPAARVVALRAGDVDLAWDVPYERVNIVEKDPRLQILSYQSIGLAFVVFNFRAKTSPIADPRVRRALTFAIDAEGIRDALMGGNGELSRGPAPSQVIGAVDAGGYPQRDVAKAKRLLAEAGHPDGLNLVLIYEAGNFAHEEEVCGAIIAQLGDAGVRVQFEELPPGGMNERRKKLDWDLMPNSVPGSFTGEASYHYYQLKSQQAFYSRRVEALLDRANQINSVDRLDLLREAMRILWSETPYLWSLGVARTFGAVRSLTGLRYIPINWLSFADAHV